MSRLLRTFGLLAICLLSGVLALVFVARVRSAARAFARPFVPDGEAMWPEKLRVYPSHPGDPVTVVRITQGGRELTPGTYRMPEIAGDLGQCGEAVKAWLAGASFTLANQTSKTIVSVGIGAMFPTRRTDLECGEPPRGVWCLPDPHWCDGGCPDLIRSTLHWGLIPEATAAGLRSRYARLRDEGKQATVLEGQVPLRLAPGGEIELSALGRVDEIMTHTDPRKGPVDVVNGIVGSEGIDEARDTKPCVERARSKTGCTFAEVTKFNFGVDLVYFEDGTIWGNYGYGYARPNPDGIFTRLGSERAPGPR